MLAAEIHNLTQSYSQCPFPQTSELTYPCQAGLNLFVKVSSLVGNLIFIGSS